MRDRVLNFFREVRGELRRVTWPSRVEVVALTVLVLLITVLLSIYVLLWDFFFQNIIAYLLGLGR